MRTLSLLVVLVSLACGDSEPTFVDLALEVRNDSGRVMECRAGYVYGLVRQPERMSEYRRVQPSASIEFIFSVPHGDFATVATDCQAEGYPAENYYTETAHVTDALTAHARCTAIYSEPSGLSELSTTCAVGKRAIGSVGAASQAGITSAIIMGYYRLTVDLLNGADAERVCDFQYSFRNWDGSLVNGPQVPLRTVPAHQTISATDSVPLNQVVAVSAACWHPAYPAESTIHAAASLRTDPVRAHVACHAIYTEASGVPSMSLSCQ